MEQEISKIMMNWGKSWFCNIIVIGNSLCIILCFSTGSYVTVEGELKQKKSNNLRFISFNIY